VRLIEADLDLEYTMEESLASGIWKRETVSSYFKGREMGSKE